MNDQQRAAMQMALDTLIDAQQYYGSYELGKEAITALRSALEQPQGEPVAYVTEPQNFLPNGLTLIQTNPDCAVQLNAGRDFGWLYMKGAEGQWVTHRKLSPEEINEAQDQTADMVVIKRESVLEKMFEQPIATPPVVPQGEWVDLTEDEMAQAYCDRPTWDGFASAVIRKFKSKNTPPSVEAAIERERLMAYAAGQMAVEAMRIETLEKVLACYSPDDTANDWADKIKELK